MVRKTSVKMRQPSTQTEDVDELLIELGCEMWQLCRSTVGWVGKLSDSRRRRATSQVDWGRSRLDEILAKRGIELHDWTGQIWKEGDPVEIVNAPGEAKSGGSVVTAALEPVVMRQGKLVRRGKVTVGTPSSLSSPSTLGKDLVRSRKIPLRTRKGAS